MRTVTKAATMPFLTYSSGIFCLLFFPLLYLMFCPISHCSRIILLRGEWCRGRSLSTLPKGRVEPALLLLVKVFTQAQVIIKVAFNDFL